LVDYKFSPDGSLIAYLISNGGSDWREVIVRDVSTLKQVGDTIRNMKFSLPSWKGNEGFYYSTYEIPKDQNKLFVPSENQTVYYHNLKSLQEQDRFIFGGKVEPHR
jgi:prolyl oligopeptidase